MTSSFQEGLGLQKKATSSQVKANPYQGLNIADFIGLGGTHEPTDEERLLMEIELKKQQLTQEEAQWKSAAAALKEATQALAHNFEESKNQLSHNLLELAFFIAREIVDYELSTQPTALSHIIQKLLEQSLSTEQRTLFLNPQDYAFIKEKNPDFINQLQEEHITILEEASLQSGQVKITSASRQLETDYQRRLLEIKKQIPGNFLASFETTPSGGDHA